VANGQPLKNALKRGLRQVARTAGPWFGGPPAPTRILTYHSIGYRRYEMNVTPKAFARQIEWLSENVPVISLKDAAAGVAGVALTFDDGYRDNLTNALPILEQNNCPATIFVVSGHLGATLPFDTEPESGQLLSVDELKLVAARGFQIGAHTRTHPRLATLSEVQQDEEIRGCRFDLEQILGQPVDVLAYPFGSALDYNATSMKLAREAGYALACANQYGPLGAGNDQFALRRIWIDSTDTLPSFQDKVSGRLDLLRLQDNRIGIAARRWLNDALRTK